MCTSLKALFSGVCQTFRKNKWDVTRAKVVQCHRQAALAPICTDTTQKDPSESQMCAKV